MSEVKDKAPSCLINKTEFRRKAIQQAKETSYYWREVVKDPRVSAATIQEAEAVLGNFIRRHIESIPRKGKTI